MKYLFCLLVLVSCFSPKRAERQLAKISHKYPEMVSGMYADSFIMVEKHDTSVEYDLIELEPQVEFQISKDTIVKHITKQDVLYKTITITKNVENTARIKELSDKLSQCNSLYQKENRKADKFKGYTKILSILLALLLLSLYFVFKRRR